MSDITAAEVAKMMAFMLSKVGKAGYSESLSGSDYRLGPNDYDCSGLVYAAAKSVGIDIPVSSSTADTEAVWFHDHGAKEISSANDIKIGDVLFFHGADPKSSPFGPIGHVGMYIGNGNYISAYDTATGIHVEPVSGDDFTVAMRLVGANISAPSSSGSSSGGGFSIDWPSQITGFFKDADDFVTKLAWLSMPASWVRIGAFLAGVLLILFAIHAFIAAGKGEPLVSMPQTIPVPV
jgi:hypothetical protein